MMVFFIAYLFVVKWKRIILWEHARNVEENKFTPRSGARRSRRFTVRKTVSSKFVRRREGLK